MKASSQTALRSACGGVDPRVTEQDRGFERTFNKLNPKVAASTINAHGDHRFMYQGSSFLTFVCQELQLYLHYDSEIFDQGFFDLGKFRPLNYSFLSP